MNHVINAQRTKRGFHFFSGSIILSMLLLLPCSLIPMTGCSSSSGGEDGQSDSQCRRLIEANNNLMTKCHPHWFEGQQNALSLIGVSASTNTNALVAACKRRLSLPGVTITASDTNSCATKLESATCTDHAFDGGFSVATPALVCTGIYDKKGSLTVGQNCEDDSQCQSGSCQKATNPSSPFAPPSQAVANGVCAKTASLNEPCGEKAQGAGCESNLYCSPDGKKSGKKICIKEHSRNVGEACALSAECVDGAVCNLKSSQCLIPISENKACSSYSDVCTAGFFCVKGKCGKLIALDQPCDPNDETSEQSSGCEAGLVCDKGSKKCAKIQLPAKKSTP